MPLVVPVKIVVRIEAGFRLLLKSGIIIILVPSSSSRSGLLLPSPLLFRLLHGAPIGELAQALAGELAQRRLLKSSLRLEATVRPHDCMLPNEQSFRIPRMSDKK